MDAPSTLAGRTPRSGPRSRFLALFLGVTLGGSACLNKPTEAPEGAENEILKAKQEEENLCQSPEKLSKESLVRHPVDIKARISAMQEYVKNSGISIPEFSFEQIEWELVGPMSKRNVFKKIVKYCDLGNKKHYSREEIELVLNSTLKDTGIFNSKVSDPLFSASSPLTEVSCDLSIEDSSHKCKKGQNCESNSRQDVSGIHVEYNENSFILVESLENTGVHELVHVFNRKWGVKNERSENETFPAKSLLNPSALELLGLEPCHAINYKIADQGGADAAQIALTNFDNARTEVISGANAWTRTSDYQLKFYTFKHLLFEKLADENDLKEKLEADLESGAITHDDLKIIGQFIFVISQEMIREIRNQQQE